MNHTLGKNYWRYVYSYTQTKQGNTVKAIISLQSVARICSAVCSSDSRQTSLTYNGSVASTALNYKFWPILYHEKMILLQGNIASSFHNL